MKKVFCIRLKGRQKFLRLFGRSSKTYGLASGCLILKPKESIGLHNTKNKEEALIILEGQAEVSYSKNSKIRIKGISFVYIPPKTDHNIKNIGKGILKYIYITACI
jgi:mannose-6-phosphate isomerase-like protein (cupin superfamily)